MNMAKVPTVLELRVWFHCLIVVRTAFDSKAFSVMLNYRAGRFIGLVVKRAVYEWASLVRRIGTEPLGTVILPYML